MKEANKIDLQGYLIIGEQTHIEDYVTGVFPIYQHVPIPEGQEPPEEVEQEITGYMVAIPVPEGLYKPRFDLVAWEAYNQPLQPQLDDKGEPVTDEDGNIVYLPRPNVALWVEGLTAEELDAIRNTPVVENDSQKIARLQTENVILTDKAESLEARNSNMQDDQLFIFEILANAGLLD